MKSKIQLNSHYQIFGIALIIIIYFQLFSFYENKNVFASTSIEETQTLEYETKSTVVHYLPYSPSVGKVRVSRTGLLYKDYYIQLGYSFVSQSYCSNVTNAFCLGNNGEFHDYQDSASYERGAIDFGSPLTIGSDVLASSSGVVIKRSSIAPANIAIQHPDGTISYYYHIYNFKVNLNDNVVGGQKIAEVAPKDDYSTAPHLHYALFSGGKEIKVRFADADAKQYGSVEGYLLPSRPYYHESFYQSQNTITNSPPALLSFVNGSSQIGINSSSVNLEICASNLSGKKVYATLYRAPYDQYSALFKSYEITANSNCVTFADMDGAGDTLAGVTYYTVASLNPISQTDAQSKRTACYSATGSKQLCDGIQRKIDSTFSFSNGSSNLAVTQSAANLEVCADNMSGKTVYVTMYRDAYSGYSSRIWRYQKSASANCLTFSDMDGSGDTFAGVTYYTVASLNPISDSDASSKRTSCYSATAGKQLCDAAQRTYSGTVFDSGYSNLEITQTAVNLQVCSANLIGKNVRATLYRDAYAGYLAKIWNYEKQASSSCVTFSDMDGSGDTFTGVTYYTVASLNTISDADASSKRTSCYSATGGAQLCDSGMRGTAPTTCYTLTTNSNPSGGGGVEVSPISSEGCATGSYKSGTSVTLSAKPNSGYAFQSWSGASGSSTTTISISSNSNVTANFSSAEYNLNWMPDSVFTGELDTSINQIRKFLSENNSCLAIPINDVDGISIDISSLVFEASQKYEINPKVILATMQKEQSAITKCPNNTALAFLMGANIPSTARAQIDLSTKYFRDYLSEIQTNGFTRSGWTTNVPKTTVDGVIVTPYSRAVAALFTYTPYAGIGWGGNNSSIGGTYLFKSSWDMFDFDQPFPPPECFVLNLNNPDSERGEILVSSPPNCGDGKYTDGTQLSIYADPNFGYLFDHWEGDYSGNESYLNITMNTNVSITANFSSLSCYKLNLGVNPINTGSVSFDPPPNCSGGQYVVDTNVTIIASPYVGYEFSGWSDDFSGNNYLEVILMNSNKNIIANFSNIVIVDEFKVFLPLTIK